MIKEIDRPPTIKETVANALRDAIWNRDLKPGKALREAELCQSLKVARGTLREAFRVLQEERLVEAHPHRGVFVTELSVQKVSEVYSLRMLLEPYAVDLAIGRGAYGEGELAEIEALLRRMGEFERRGDSLELVKSDVVFHQLICKPSGHLLLLDVLRSLQSLTTLCVTNLNVLDPDKALQEQLHGEILQAIRAGDSAHAQDIIKKHLRDARDPLLAAMMADTTEAR